MGNNESIDNTEKRPEGWWDNWFLGLAKYISTASKDPSTKIGAVIVDEHRRIISTGYNGFARGTSDRKERLSNREEKYARIVHGEVNAIVFARRSLENCTLYTFPFQPCDRCTGIIIQSGIKRVVAPIPSEDIKTRWGKSLQISQEMFDEAGICLDIIPFPC